LKLSSLLYKNEYRSNRSPDDIRISSIVSDTSKITPGCLFVCIRGSRFDSHLHLPFIVASGAAAVIVEIGSCFPRIPSCPIFEVPDSRRALAFAWSRFCGCPEKKLSMIGITGTNGKTTTAYLLRSILSDAGYRCGLIGTVEFLGDKAQPNLFSSFKRGSAKAMTTPDPEILYPLLAKMAEAGMTHAVMEVSSHALALGKVAPISFRLGLFTNLSPEHLDFHGSLDAYLSAKRLLLSSSDAVILNSDSPYSERAAEGIKGQILRCGTKDGADFRASDITLDGIRGVSYQLHAREQTFPVSFPIPGSFSVANSLLAASAALWLGVPVSTLEASLAAFPGVRGRLERIPTGESRFSVFLDYAHTEAALRSLLTTVRAFREKDQRVILLFGCGGNRDRTKRAPMGTTAEELADFVYVTSDNPRHEDPKQIIREILSGMSDKSKRRVIVNREQAIRQAIRDARPGDILLLVGKGHESYEIVGANTRPFDERKIVMDALNESASGHTITGTAE
jgi:UDP-N-acetylmuramoyl-L-alanyl-D-glutamate--2,6-diaminopimelate ligase